MANNNVQGYGVLRFAVDTFQKEKLDKMTDKELVALYTKYKNHKDYCVDYVRSLGTFFNAMNNDCVDTENWWHYVIPNTPNTEKLGYE